MKCALIYLIDFRSLAQTHLHKNLSTTSEESFIDFFHKNYSSFCFFANRYISDPIMSTDIVGDVALKILEKKTELENIVSLKSYFYSCIRNACINKLRKEKAQLKNEAAYQACLHDNEQTVLENIIRTETLREVEAAIQALPPQCQKVFLKLFFEGKSLSETAKEMNLSIFTVKAQRQRGIKLLRNRFVQSILAFFLLTMACWL